jgi:hypothetical protein
MGNEPNDAAPALGRQNLRELIDDHIRTHGAFTDAELAEGRAALYGVGEAAAVAAGAAGEKSTRQALDDFLALADQVSKTAVFSNVDASDSAEPIAVTAKAWEGGWELHIEGVGVTQSAGVSDAEATVRDYLNLDGLDRDAPLDITFEFRGRHTTSYER